LQALFQMAPDTEFASIPHSVLDANRMDWRWMRAALQCQQPQVDRDSLHMCGPSLLHPSIG
jgi:hypothetical protein